MKRINKNGLTAIELARELYLSRFGVRPPWWKESWANEIGQIRPYIPEAERLLKKLVIRRKYASNQS